MKNKFIAACAITLFCVISVNIICLYKPLWLYFERSIYDLKYRLTVPDQRNEEIVIIDIDEKSLDKLGRYQNWPRVYFAEIIDYLHEARCVGIDVLFAEPDTLPEYAAQYYSKPNFDSLMNLAIERHKKIVLVSTIEQQPVYKTHNRVGIGQILTDDDGVVRHGFARIAGQPTFAAVISEMVTETEVPFNRFLIYYVSATSFRRISFSDVYLRRVPQEFFKDKIILVGGTAQGLFDFTSVPYQKDDTYPGILVHANMINSFINKLKITEISYKYLIFFMLILSFMISYLGITSKARVYVTCTVFLLVVFCGASVLLFNNQYEMGIIRPAYVFIAVIIGSLTYRYRFEEREKRKIKAIFSRYYSKELVNKVMTHPPQLGGEKINCTIMFADIRNFTPFAEKTDPRDVAQKLNTFLNEMVQSVFEYQGRVDKFIGDCVMAVFGSPVKVKNHSLNACYAACDMVRKAEKLGLKIGIGINSGEAISGNFGSHMRMEYTVIGDSVNLASRLEGVTKQFEQNIVVGPETYAQVTKDNPADLEFTILGQVTVKGKAEPITVYSPVRH
jgi:adenylate cyclase